MNSSCVQIWFTSQIVPDTFWEVIVFPKNGLGTLYLPFTLKPSWTALYLSWLFQTEFRMFFKLKIWIISGCIFRNFVDTVRTCNKKSTFRMKMLRYLNAWVSVYFWEHFQSAIGWFRIFFTISVDSKSFSGWYVLFLKASKNSYSLSSSFKSSSSQALTWIWAVLSSNLSLFRKTGYNSVLIRFCVTWSIVLNWNSKGGDSAPIAL